MFYHIPFPKMLWHVAWMPFPHNRSRNGFFWIFHGKGCGNTVEIPKQNCGKIPRETRGFPMPKDRYITCGQNVVEQKRARNFVSYMCIPRFSWISNSDIDALVRRICHFWKGKLQVIFWLTHSLSHLGSVTKSVYFCIVNKAFLAYFFLNWVFKAIAHKISCVFNLISW